MSGGGWRPSVGFDDVVATLTAGFDGGVVAFAVAQQDEATGHIAEGNAPVVHQLAAVVAIEGLLAAGDDAGADAQFGGRQHHILGTAESVGNAVEEIALGEDDTDGGGAVEAALERGVVDDAGLLVGNKAARETRAVEFADVHPAHGFGELGVAQGDNHTALAATGIGGVEARLDDAFQILSGYLPLLVFADGTAMSDKFKDVHNSFQHCGSAA